MKAKKPEFRWRDHDSAVCGFNSSTLVAAEGDCPGLVVVVVVAAWVKVKVMARRHRIHL